MTRRIDGFHREAGAWVAELSCGHDRTLEDEPWASAAEGRAAHLGGDVSCAACARLELPLRLVPTRTSPEWTDESMPDALRRAHTLRDGSWGRLLVLDGRLRFTAATTPPLETVVPAGGSQPIPPGLPHDVQPLGPARFLVEFFAVRPWDDPGRELGGESSCFAHLLCPDCGAVLDGGPHLPDCPRAA